MSEAFDIYTLLFLVLAVVIFIRLRNVLGRRTGNERPPYDPYTDRRRQAGQPARGQRAGGGAAARPPGRSASERDVGPLGWRISRRGLAGTPPRTARSGNRSPL